jgi:hypothetical protein
MPIKLLINNGAGDVDYTNYVVPNSLVIGDSINQPTRLQCTLVNINSAFVVPKIGAYFKVFSSKYQKFLATGFITAEPVRKLQGPSRHAPTTKFQLYLYDIIGASDEWLANVKSNPIIPAYVNQGKGQILANLLNALVPSFYNTTSFVASGDLVPAFQYDPSKTWSDIAKEFADASRYRYKVINKTFYFQPLGDAALGISYDEDSQPEEKFDPYALQTDVLIVPPVNDAIVLGDVEPQDYREDHFIGDGLTGNFALHHEAFRASTALLLQEDWAGNTLAADLWTKVDPFTNFSLAGGSLNVVSPPNLLSSMNEFGDATWLRDGGAVVLSDVATDPIGDSTADVLVKGAGTITNFSELYEKVTNPSVGAHVTFAVWLRVASGANASVTIKAGDFAGSPTSLGVTVTTAWQRFSVTSGVTSTGLVAAGITDTRGAGAQLQVWGAQLVLGSSAPSVAELNQTYIQAKNGVELGGVVYLQHGEFTFTDSGVGILGGVYNNGSVFASRTCEFGFDVRPSTNVTTSVSGASGVLIQPIRLGVRVGPQIITQLNHNYVLSNYVNCQRWARANSVFRSLVGSPFGGNILSASGAITWTVLDYDINNPSASPVATVFSQDASSLPAFGTYLPVNSANLNLFFNFTLISQPPQATLEVRSLYGPTGLLLPVGRPVAVPGSVAAPTVVVGSSVTGASVSLPLTALNALTFSEQFDDAIWSKTNTAVTPNAVVDPNGNLTADALVFSGGVPSSAFIYQRIFPPIVAGNSWVFSVWLRASAGTPTIDLGIEDIFSIHFAGGPTTFGLTTAWQRFSVAGTLNGSSVDLSCFLTSASDQTKTYYAWGAQLEKGSTPSNYVGTPFVNVNRAGAFEDTTMYAKPGGLDLNTTDSNVMSSALLGKTLSFQGALYAFGDTATGRIVNTATEGQGQEYFLADANLPQQPYFSLRVAAVATNGDKLTQPIIVRYTDGSADVFTQSFSDWKTGAGTYPNESVGKSMAYSNLSSGVKDNTTTKLFSYAYNLNLAKSVKSINIPSCSDLVFFAISLIPVTVIATTSTAGAVASGMIISGALDIEQKYLLGFGFQQQVATLQEQNDTTALSFYPDTLPGVGARIRLRSRTAGASIGRVRDTSSIAATAVTAGDDGVRAGIFTGLSPLPRTSEEAEFAASALITDRVHTQFKGTYSFTDDLLTPYIPGGGANLLADAQNLVSTAWVANAVSGQVVADQFLAPDRSLTADALVDLSTTGVFSVTQFLTSNDSVRRFFNIYIKAGSAGVCAVFLDVGTDDLFDVTWAFAFDARTGHCSASDLGDPPDVVNIQRIPNGWWLVSVRFPVTLATISYSVTLMPAVASALAGTGLGVVTPTVNATLGSTLFWGAQLSVGTFNTPYQPVLADYPLSGRFLPCNSPRRGIVSQNLLVSDVSMTVLESRTEKLAFQVTFGPDLYLEKLLALFVQSKPVGVLLPQDKTTRPTPQALASVGTTFLPDLVDAKITNLAVTPVNLLTFSEQFDNAIWSKTTGVTVTPNVITDPLGGQTADRIVYDGSGTSGNFRIFQALVGASTVGARRTFSIWLRCESGTVSVRIASNSGFAFLTCNLTTAWQRFQLTTVADGSVDQVFIYSPAATNTAFTIDAWGAQLEENINATDYVRTSAFTKISANSFIVDSGVDPATIGVPIEVRRIDSGWGTNDQNLVGVFTQRVFSLQRQVLDQTWYLRLATATKASRFSKVIRVNYPMPPAAPSIISSDSRFVQLDFSGDIRNIYGIELRAGDNATILAQRPVFAKQDMYFDLQSLPNYKTVLAFGRVIYAYFFNLQWEYSDFTQVPLSAPPGPILVLGNKFGSLVEARFDQLSRTDINYTTYQVAQDANFTVSVISVTGSQQPAVMSVNVPNSTGSQFFARARRTDYFGDGPFGPTLNIPYGTLIASSWSVGQGSIPPTLDNQVSSLFTYTGTALAAGGANTGRIVITWPAFLIIFADNTQQSVLAGSLDTQYMLSSSTSTTTPYIFYPRLPAFLPGVQPQFVGLVPAHVSKSVADAQACVADGFIPLGGAAIGFTFNVPVAPATPGDPPSSGGGGDGGTGCVSVNMFVVTPAGKVKVTSVKLGHMLRGVNTKTGKMYWNLVHALSFTEERCVKIVLQDGSSCICSRSTPLPVWRGSKGRYTGCILAKELTSEHYLLNDKFKRVQIAKLTDVGFRKVARITLKPRHTFFADSILTHNDLLEKNVT